MLPSRHLVATTLISVLFWRYFGSFKYALVSFLAGIFIDLDHFLDYYLHHGRKIKLRQFYNFFTKGEMEFVVLVFHSFELIIALWLAIALFRLGIFWLALAVGLTQHMFFDLLANAVKPQAYFVIYRIKKSFKKEHFFRKAGNK